MATPLFTTSEAQSSSVSSPKEHAPRRRKLRKGTSSCWECKRRKIRCVFEAESGPSCVSCRRRGCQCVPQDVPDEDSICEVDTRYHEVGQRIVRVESLVGQLLRQGCHVEAAPTPWGESISCRRAGYLTVRSNKTSDSAEPHQALEYRLESGGDSKIPHPSSLSDAHRRPHRFRETHRGQHLRTPEPSKQFSLSSLIYSFLPSAKIAAIIIHRGRFFSLPIQMLRQPFKTILDSAGLNELQSLIELPPRTARPIYLARKLIQLAICLQQMDPATESSDLCLEGSVRDVAGRYLQAASRYVTSQDSLVISSEGLETLMLEGLYHINSGNWRLAWLVFRRALGIATLLGLQVPRHQQVGSTATCGGSSAEFLWFRLVYIDRFLSLMLSLPSTVTDDSFASDHLLSAEAPLGKLERIHAVAMGRIISRNERMRCSTRDDETVLVYYDETQDIDNDLKLAARTLPTKWWTLPKLGPTATSAQSKAETARLIMQTHQHDLLVLLHLPYLIPGPYAQSVTRSTMAETVVSGYTYSKLAALNASREVLARLTLLHDSTYLPFYSRSINFKALTAAITLLLAHIEGHRGLDRANVLEHQRPHDLEIVEQAIETMKSAARLNNDVPSHSSVQVLRRIAEVEAKAADGADYIVWREVGIVGQVECSVRENGNALEFSTPYFGKIHILHTESKRGGVNEAGLGHSDVVSADHCTSTPLDNLGSPTQEVGPAVRLPRGRGHSGSYSLAQLPIPGFTTYDFIDNHDS